MGLRMSHYEHLIDQELVGIISPEDQAILDKAKAEHPEVYQLWEERQELFSEYKVQQWLKEKSVLPPASTIPPKKRSNTPLLLALAAVGIVAASIFFYLSDKKYSPKTNIIELRLENGARFDLSQQGEMKKGSFSLKNQHGSLSYSAAMAESALLSVPAGKNYKIMLSDGTEVTLNAESTIRFFTSFKNSPTREIYITGEAYLKVAKDANHPFIVKTAKGSVRVLGTEFNVNSYAEGKLEVALVEGKVMFNTSKDSVELQPGFSAVSTDNIIQTQKIREGLLSWREGVLVLCNTPMKDLLKDFHRLFGREVVLDNLDLEKEFFGGKLYTRETIDSNLNQLKGLAGFEYYTDEYNVIHLK